LPVSWQLFMVFLRALGLLVLRKLYGPELPSEDGTQRGNLNTKTNRKQYFSKKTGQEIRPLVNLS